MCLSAIDSGNTAITGGARFLFDPGGVDTEELDVLYDTGASSNFMSLACYEKNRLNLTKTAKQVKSKVRLGDGDTYKEILFEVSCQMRFNVIALGCEDNNNEGVKTSTPKQYDVKLKFNVFDNSSHDVIIGHPTLVRELYSFFAEKLRQEHDECNTSTHDVHRLFTLQQGDLVQPFPYRTEEAPEDKDAELPAHGREYLLAMEEDYDERLKKFLEGFQKQVNKDFAAATRIIQLLKTKGKKVFVADNWEGIRGLALVEFIFRNLPDSHRCSARPINPKLAENFYKELKRLKGYLFVESDSPIVSPIVVAYKATYPFIRVCGDFTWINKYIVMPQVPIPAALQSLQKISNFKIFIDVDITNAFHQIKLGPITSKMLSIITPEGTYKPLFLLEGTTPATGILHQTIVDIFRDFEEWTIVLFDNILILADTYEDAYAKFEKFLDRCIERNIFLKFEKSFLGVHEVKFFGYICRHKTYHLSEERTKAIIDIPFPTNTKQVQSFLGTCLFYKSFIPDYSHHAAQMNDMTHKNFPWGDKTKWNVDYVKAFEDLKQVLARSFTLHYPDYSLDWVLRVDASTLGIGSVLLQFNNGVWEPIMFQSHKFSLQATKWSTIEQECYAIFYSVFQLAFYLRCKPFIIETDHRNLVWMYQSLVPKIIRWHIYLQSFNFVIRHIPGKYNIVADMLSRQWSTTPVKDFEEGLAFLGSLTADKVAGEPTLDFESVMKQVHGFRMAHHSTKRTWEALCKYFPGHGYSQRQVQNYVDMCPICQKDRVHQVAAVTPKTKTLHVQRATSMVCSDTFEVVEADDGMRYIVVVLNLFTRYVKLYPVKDKTALTTAACLFQYVCDYGLFDTLRTDPGSDFTSAVVDHLTSWLGIRHSFTLPNNPQADGVEGTNKQIKRHLLAICQDELCKRTWSSPTVLPVVQLILNEQLHSETGCIPFHAQFGDNEAILRQIPAGLPLSEASHKFIQLLATNLRTVRDLSAKYQAKIKAKRVADQPVTSANRYQPGDFVTLTLDKWHRKDKLTTRNAGPYEVVLHPLDSNHVDVRNLIHDSITAFDVKDLKPYFAESREAAKKSAEYDEEQHAVYKILSHRGNPETRTTMEFLVKFVDTTEVWLTYTKDVTDTVAFESYCSELPQLRPLLMSDELAKKLKRTLLKEDITLVSPKTCVYVDIREWGPGHWYSTLNHLPDKDRVTYVLQCVYGDFCGSAKTPHRKINAYFPTIDVTYSVDNWFVSTYGHKYTTQHPDHVVLDKQLLKKYQVNLTSR